MGRRPRTRATGRTGGGRSPSPTKVPSIDRIPEIHLLPFSPEAIEAFIAIEEPLEPQDPPAGHDQYDSIGAFYGAIADGLRRLCPEDVFAEARVIRAGCQVPPGLYYGGGGSVTEVKGLDTALAALAQIVHQGEGAPPGILRQTAAEHNALAPGTPGAVGDLPVVDRDVLPFGWKMYSHYARFKEIRAGRHYEPDQRVDDTPAGDVLPVEWGEALPMTPDPRTEDYEGPYRSAMERFDHTYSGLVDTLYRCFNGTPDALEGAVVSMYELKYQALALLRTPSPLDPTRTLGPAFQYLPAAGSPSPDTRSWARAPSV